MSRRVEVARPGVASARGHVFARYPDEWADLCERFPTKMAECYDVLATEAFPSWPTPGHFPSQRDAKRALWEYEVEPDVAVVIYARGGEGPVIVYCGHPRGF